MGIAAAIAGAAVVGGGASIIAGNKAAKAQKKAAAQASDATLTASRESNALLKEQFDTTRADYAPWREAGGRALGKLESMYMGGQSDYTPIDTSKFEASPGYQYRINEAMKAIERSAAARGGLRSGATMKSIGDAVQGMAGAEFGDWYNREAADRSYKAARTDTAGNRIAALAGIGQEATASTAAAGQAYASGASNNTMTAGQTAAQMAMASGQAKAANAVNTGNAINGTVSNLAGMYLYGKGNGWFN